MSRSSTYLLRIDENLVVWVGMVEALLASILTLGVLFFAPIVAHLVGRAARSALEVRPGSIREWMPSIPDHIEKNGRAEERWEARRRAVETNLLKRFADGIQGAEANQLAAQLGEDPEVVAGALDHLREEIPCRLRVTRNGLLLYDFAAADIAKLRAKRRRRWPTKVALFVLGALANLGAAWPLVLSLIVAVGALVTIATGGGAIAVGGVALTLVAGLFVVNLLGGWLTHLLLTPGWSWNGPKLGSAKHAEESFATMQQEQSAGWSIFGSDGGGASADAGAEGCDLLFNADEAIGGLFVVLLVAIVAASTASLFVFLRGIWRAATGAGMPPLDVSPTQWVRASRPNDTWEKYIPTNDLVMRVMRVVRRLVSHTHPRDSTIVGRIIARASGQRGRIAAVEIALQEGLDLDEATAVGARLSGRAGGTIDVTEDGELDFVFPPEALSKAPAEWDDDLHAEYLDYVHETGDVQRRPHQRRDSLPVNLPGITWSHVKSADRLAAGTVLMMMTGMFALALIPGLGMILAVVVDSVLPLMALGTFALAGGLRHVVSVQAEIGVRRDVRRAAFLHVRRALNRGDDVVSFGNLADQLWATFKLAWRGLTRELIVKEIDGVCIDLDLEPHADGDPAAASFRVDGLAARLDSLERHRETVNGIELDFVEQADEVIFDSAIEPERVRALR